MRYVAAFNCAMLLVASTSSVTGLAAEIEPSYLGVEFGMDAGQALERLAGYSSTEDEYDEGWGCYDLYPRDRAQPRFMVIDDRVVRISLASGEPGIRTGSGLGIGSSKADILPVHEHAWVRPHKYITDGGNYVEVPLDGLGLFFELRGGIVFKFHMGLHPAVAAVEGCL